MQVLKSNETVEISKDTFRIVKEVRERCKMAVQIHFGMSYFTHIKQWWTFKRLDCMFDSNKSESVRNSYIEC